MNLVVSGCSRLRSCGACVEYLLLAIGCLLGVCFLEQSLLLLDTLGGGRGTLSDSCRHGGGGGEVNEWKCGSSDWILYALVKEKESRKIRRGLRKGRKEGWVGMNE